MDPISNHTAADTPPPPAIALTYVNSLVALLGMPLNVTVLVLCHRHVRANSYMWFIASLAVADLMTSVEVFVLGVPDLISSDQLCRVIVGWSVVNMGAAITSHPLMAMNRYVAVIHSPWYHRIFERPLWIGAILGLNWALPIAFMCVDAWYGCLSQDGPMCFFNTTPEQIECNMPKIVHFLSCYLISAFCYTRLFLALRSHQRQLSTSGGVVSRSSSLSTDTQLLKLMALHALVPLCVHLPSLLILLAFPQLRQNSPNAIMLIMILFMTEALLNALLTLFIVKLFRMAILKGLETIWDWVACKKEKPHQHQQQQVIPISESKWAEGRSRAASITPSKHG